MNGAFSGKNRPFTNAIRNEVKFKMITGIKKKNKLITEITPKNIEDYYKTKLKEGLSVETIK